MRCSITESTRYGRQAGRHGDVCFLPPLTLSPILYYQLVKEYFRREVLTMDAKMILGIGLLLFIVGGLVFLKIRAKKKK